MGEFLRHLVTFLSLVVLVVVGCRQTHSDAPRLLGPATTQERHRWIEKELLPWLEQWEWT